MGQGCHQYRHFKQNCKLTLETFEIKPKSEEIVLLSHIFAFFTTFLIKTFPFCFGKFRFLLVVGDILKQKVFSIPDSDYLVDNVIPPISANIEIFLHSISISTQPNSLPTSKLVTTNDS